MEYLIIIVPIVILIILLAAIVEMINYSHEPTFEEMMGWDFRGCEQMRESGWTESEIKNFMDDNNGYYDKDFE